MTRICTLFFCFLCLSPAKSQHLDHVLGQIIIQFEADTELSKLTEALYLFQGQPTKARLIQQISAPMNIWVLEFDYTNIHEERFLNFLKKHPQISIAQFNHLVSMRETIPNDPSFSDQWQYLNVGGSGGVADADIDAELAWDITTGGLTQQGDTIVVAILDSGVDIDHSDLVENLWINHAEIPDNGIDDDNNGYIDDYQGWNINSDADNVNSSNSHGSSVAGIVGAKGNNDLGVTGVNWDVKLMIIRNDFNSNEAAVLEAYGYALDARIRYNETNGAQGAFVVATNASWGVNFGNPDDAPLWCAFYDTLGEAGIISCGATINGNENVDEVGDLPTTCPSDFLISITNTNRSDVKVPGAGFGSTHIDLGAPGEDAFTTSSNNNYGDFSGTSSATPHVAGAIALLYAAPCDNLIALAKADPAAGASLARQYIFDGVDSNASLNGITATGGRLNIFNSLDLLMNNCSPCPEAFNLNTQNLSDTAGELVWSAGVNANSSNLRWRQVGSPNWMVANNASSPFSINGLTACTDYEFQIDAVCTNQNSGFTSSFVFTSDGCCLPPENISANGVSSTFASIVWSPVLAAESYTIIVEGPSGGFVFSNITNTVISLFDLEPCTTYEVSIQTVCANETTPFSDPITFMTSGCGSCLDLTYCSSMGDNGTFEWIETVSIANLNNTSGMDDGFGDYTNLSADMNIGESYSLSLTPDFSGSAFPEYFKIWIDYNQDGEFDPTDELAFDPGAGFDETIEGEITIPGTAIPGSTRMRVGMAWIGPSGTEEPDPCETFDFGEVEDYCVNIINAPCDLATDLDTIVVSETSATITWMDLSDDHDDHNLRIKTVQSNNWEVYLNVEPPFTVDNLDACNTYEFQIEANCVVSTATSGYTQSFLFDSDCLISVDDLSTPLSVQVFPNPFDDHFIIEWSDETIKASSIKLYNLQGQLIISKILSGEQNPRIQIDASSIPQGLYLIELESDAGIWTDKVVKF